MCVRAYHCMCVCEPHLLQKYGCIGFEDGSSTGSSPAWCKMWWESKEKETNRYFPKIAMLFGVAPSAKNSDFTARLRHLPSLFIYFFCAIYFPSGVHSSGAEETEVILEVHHFLIESRPSPDFMDGKSRSHVTWGWVGFAKEDGRRPLDHSGPG